MRNSKTFKSKYSSFDSRILACILWIHMFIWLFNLPIAQLQMQLFGKRILTLSSFAIIEGMILFLLFVFKAAKIRIDSISKGAICLFGMLLFIGLIGLIINPEVDLYWRFYYVIYWILPLIVVVASNQTEIELNRFMKVLLFIIFIHSILILVQHFSNSILWPFRVDENGNNFFYISEGYYNTNSRMVRCPGICISGLDAGVLLVFGISLTWSIPKLKKWNKIFLTILFVIAIWFTGTRNIYILFAFVVVFVNVCNIIKKRRNKNLICSSIVIFAVALYTWIFSYLGEVSPNATANVLTDTLSAKLRLINWENVLVKIQERNVFQILFGHNVWQSAGTNLLIDNMYLEFLLMGGIVTLVSFCCYFAFIAYQIGNKGNKMLYPLAAFVSGVFLYGVANVLGNIYMTLIVISVVIVRNKEQLME
ncbi:hypothetical protein [Clostridium polynesiense]|uniref:hypothetical protein n=1 Tax=Clostridium polynesiense TaxID=1325933 RepID=UPI000591131B|nr:hypothetical protein [Clostridium polynesiense]